MSGDCCHPTAIQICLACACSPPGRPLAAATIAEAGVSEGTILDWGVGTTGAVNRRTGVVHAPPTLPDWEIPLRDRLERRTGKNVIVGNDASVAAIAEWQYGAGQGTRDLIYITVSTGIGGAILVDGRLLLGRDGAAGEIGHMTVEAGGPVCVCGNPGYLEALASGTAIARMAREQLEAGADTALRLAGSPVAAADVVGAAQAGDRVAREIMGLAARALGIGVASLINLFNPEIVVIGGGVAQAGPLLLEPMQAVAMQRSLPSAGRNVRFVLAQFGDDAGLIGALVLATDAISSIE